jgi:hypothetical protein
MAKRRVEITRQDQTMPMCVDVRAGVMYMRAALPWLTRDVSTATLKDVVETLMCEQVMNEIDNEIDDEEKGQSDAVV